MDISSKISKENAQYIINKYHNYKLNNNSPYIVFFAKINNVILNIYVNKKKEYTLTLNSKNKEDLKPFVNALNLKAKEKKSNKESKHFVSIKTQIGSDEVGTGDFFGPITVVASLVKEEDYLLLKELGVVDSKKLDDDKIKKIAKIAIKKFPYSSLALDNIKYNSLIKKGYNMNQIKAILHNCALLNLHKKYPDVTYFYVDEFTSPKKYFEYLKNEKEIYHKIIFHTKGETYYPSVALSSVIARYSFLIRMEALNKKYHTRIPFGAGETVDKFAKEFVKKYGINELDKIVKKNFKNYLKLI